MPAAPWRVVVESSARGFLRHPAYWLFLLRLLGHFICVYGLVLAPGEANASALASGADREVAYG